MRCDSDALACLLNRIFVGEFIFNRTLKSTSKQYKKRRCRRQIAGAQLFEQELIRKRDSEREQYFYAVRPNSVK